MIKRTFRLVPAAYFVGKAMIILIGLAVLGCLVPFTIGLFVSDPNMTQWQFLAMQLSLVGLSAVLTSFFGFLHWAERTMRVDLTEEGLHLHYSPVAPKGRLFPFSTLHIAEARLGCLPAD